MSSTPWAIRLGSRVKSVQHIQSSRTLVRITNRVSRILNDGEYLGRRESAIFAQHECRRACDVWRGHRRSGEKPNFFCERSLQAVEVLYPLDIVDACNRFALGLRLGGIAAGRDECELRTVVGIGGNILTSREHVRRRVTERGSSDG